MRDLAEIMEKLRFLTMRRSSYRSIIIIRTEINGRRVIFMTRLQWRWPLERRRHCDSSSRRPFGLPSFKPSLLLFLLKPPEKDTLIIAHWEV